MNKSIGLFGVLLLSGVSVAAPVNTSDPGVYAAFAAGATIVDFESVGGATPLALTSYANATNSSTAVPAGAQLSGQIPGAFFHSGGGSFSNPFGNPGTPAALLQLGGSIAADARSGSNVIGSLEISSDLLDIDNFIEIIFLGGDVNRAGVWLNPSLGNVLITAFDNAGNTLESVIGSAGNFAGLERLTNDIRFISLVSLSAAGFTADDLTYGRAGTTTRVDTPPTLVLLLAALAAMAVVGSRRRARMR